MSIKLNRKGAGLAGEDRVKENQNLEMIEQEFAGLETAKTDSAAAKLSALEALAKAESADSLSKNVESDLTEFINDVSILEESENLLNVNDPNHTVGKFVSPTTGALSNNASYDSTGFIEVTEGKKLILPFTITSNGFRFKAGMRFIAAFDEDSNILPSLGSSADTTDFTIQPGVSKVIVSYLNRSDYSERMLVEVDVTDNSVPSFKPYFAPRYKTLVDTDSTLSVENTPADSKAVGDALDEINQNILFYKNPSATKKVESLAANTSISIPEFPEMLKAGQRFSYNAKFSTFTTGDIVKLGFINSTYGTYQSWLELSSDRVKWMLSGTTPLVNQLHGLTLSGFVNVTVNITADKSQVELIITTVSGTYSFKQTVDSTRYNAIGTLTALSSMATTNVVLSGTCTQFKYDTWLIGDSYFGDGPARIGGRLMEWGYAKGVLISGVGGLNSQVGYGELQKLLRYGTPKTLVWYLGMNDNETTVNTYFPLVEALCEQNGIELVFNRIPFVPSRLTHNAAVNNYVLASGKRYIDSYSAVGADVNGNWYAGHINTDGVHPDPLGGAALTSKLLADAPEVLSEAI